jgi:hypothetical protein
VRGRHVQRWRRDGMHHVFLRLLPAGHRHDGLHQLRGGLLLPHGEWREPLCTQER